MQCSSTENHSMRQWPDRTGAQRAVSGKDLVAIYQNRGSYRGIPVMRDWLILSSVKREFNKLFFVIRDLKVLRDP